MKTIQISDNLKNKIIYLKDIMQQFTGIQFQNDEEFIEFLIDGYLQSIEWPADHWHWEWGCCGWWCGCSH